MSPTDIHWLEWLTNPASRTFWGFWLSSLVIAHSQIPLHYGWLEHLLISPAQHQQHHAIGSLRCNYGSMLAIWDKSFGSWRSGRQVLPLPVTTHSLSRHSHWQLVHSKV